MFQIDKYLVSLEVARKLREKGYNEDSMAVWEWYEDMRHDPILHCHFSTHPQSWIKLLATDYQ